MFNDLVTTVDSGKAAVLTLLNLSAAFDTVDHPTLLSRLEARFGVSGPALLWFCSYIANRSSGVFHLWCYFVPCSSLFWCPSGLCSGPYVVCALQPLHSIIRQHGLSAQNFADVTQIYTEFEISNDGVDQIEAYRRIKCCAEDTKTWMFENKLQLNEDKSDGFVFASVEEAPSSSTFQW